MASHRSSVGRMLSVLAMAACTVIVLAGSRNKTTTRATAEDGPTVEPSPISHQYLFDLRLITETVGSLRRIHTDAMDTDIPVAAKPLLTTLKHQLRDLIANRLRFEKRQVSTQQLQARAIVDLSDLGLIVDEEGSFFDASEVEKGYSYGDIESITVARPHDCFDLIAVTTTLGVCCGEDTSLYLFKYEDGAWRLDLADEKNDYDRIDVARRLFEFGVSWLDENHDIFVVTASVNSWCSSNWQSITFRVLRPGQEPYEPRVLLSRSQTIYLGAADPPYRLEVDDSDFTLKFWGDKYEDSVSRPEEEDSDPEGLKDSLKELVRCRVKGDAVITQK